MLGFGKHLSFNSKTLAQDASTIINETNFVLLRAAWDEFLHILRADDTYDEDEQHSNLLGLAKHTWYGLQKIQKYNGDLLRFGIFELHLLKALISGYLRYDEILHVLIDHHDDEKEGEYIFTAYPKLHNVLPHEFDNPGQVIEVLVETTRQYQWHLEEFSKNHQEDLENGIKLIIKRHH